ncbi:MAG TPA: anti-sigma regulatory factor [Gemmataceae bacterium]|nr:anti-sigma regulatory factor [Gemmataceae bacterium]
MSANSLSVPTTLDSLEEIAAFVQAAAEAAGLGQQAHYRLRLATDELVTNIITHGYKGAAVPGTLELRFEMDEKTLRVILEDRGVPFDPRQLPAPDDLHLPVRQRKIGGLGVYLALQSVDRFDYERIDDRNRNVLIMDRPPPVSA